MTIAKIQTVTTKPTSTSDKIEAPQILDRDARVRKLEEGEARITETFARAQDAGALVEESFRQLFARRDELPQEKLVGLSQLLAQLIEGTTSIAASLIKQQYEDAQKFLQLSQDFAREAARENDPESKHRLRARSKAMASLATSCKKKADTAKRKLLAQINVVPPAPAHTESDADKTKK